MSRRPARAWRSRTTLAVLALAVIAAAPAGVVPAHAQVRSTSTSTSTPASDASIRLVSQTPWVGVGGEFDLGLIVESPDRADVEVAVTVRQPVASRSAFVQTLSGRLSGSVIDVSSATLAELNPGPNGAVFVRLPVQDPSQQRDRTRVLLRSAGVYPVTVELRVQGGGAVLDRFVTHLLYAPTPAKQKLNVAWLVPYHATPSIDASGRRRIPAEVASALEGLTRSIDAHRDVALTIVPTPETAEAVLDAQGAGATASPLPALAPGRQLVGGPYVSVDLPAFEGALANELVSQTTRGTEAIGGAWGQRPDPTTRVIEGPLTTDSLARLEAQQVERIALPEKDLASLALRVTLTQPFQLAVRQGSRIDAVAADTGLSDHFVAGAPPVLAAHQLLADLAVIYFDSPGLERGVVALPPRSWRPDPAFVEALLAGLESSPLLQGSTLDQLFQTVPPALTARRVPVTRALSTSQPVSSLPAAEINATRDHLESFGSVLDSDNPLFGSIEGTLLASESADLRTGQRTAYLRAINRRIERETGRIRIPVTRSITLTARTGEVPITIASDLAYPVHVVVEVSSDKLKFPAGATKQVDLLHANTTIRVPVAARASGTFPLAIRLLSPDGRLVVGRSRFTVRSSAFSGIGAFLSIGAIVFLLAWWGSHIVRRRHDQRLEAVLP